MNETSTGMVRVTRSSKCAISIAEVSQDGSCVKLENSSDSKEFDLSGWTLERDHPKGKASYKFGKDVKLGKREAIKVFSYSNEDEAKKEGGMLADEKDCYTWGLGNGQCVLKDSTDNEKATSTIQYKS